MRNHFIRALLYNRGDHESTIPMALYAALPSRLCYVKKTVFNNIRDSFLSAEEKMYQITRLKQQFESFEPQISHTWRQAGIRTAASTTEVHGGTPITLFRCPEAGSTQLHQFMNEPQNAAWSSTEREKCLSKTSEKPRNQPNGRTFAF